MTAPSTNSKDRNDLRYLVFLAVLMFIVSFFTSGCAGGIQ